MKINVAFILLGLLLLAIGYLILQISIPWIRFEWSPIPVSFTEINPFEPIGYILAAFGIIFLIFGFTTNPIIRLFFAISGVIFLIAFLKGWISLDWIRSLMP
jgi:hypothetical protein